MAGIARNIELYNLAYRLAWMHISERQKRERPDIAAPELPTATELGLVGMNVIGSIGLLAPAGTPVEFIEQIAQATRTAVAEPAYQRLLIDVGIEPVLDSNPEKLRRTLAADVALWAPVVQKLGLKID